jgi:hypothetical protein
MFESLKAKILFGKLLGRPDIQKAYKMVGPEDSWYNTIKKVHESLAEIQKLPHDHLQIMSHDGLMLQGVYYPCENAKATVICVHGFGSHAEREWAFPGLFYLSLGFNVLIPYQRAHGPSEGKRITFGALEHIDMMDWVDKINEISPDKSIVIHGLSMGGGIVLQLSNKDMKNVKCLISDAPSRGIESFFVNVSRDVFKREGEKVCACALADFKSQTGRDAREFDGVEIVKKGKYPLLLSAGSMEHLEKLFETIKANNPSETEMIILDGCNHGNGMYKQTELYQGKIKEFVLKHI